MREPTHPRRSSSRSRTPLIVAGVVLAVVLIGFLSFQYMNTRNELKKARDPKAAAKIEAEELADKIGKVAELPTNERPTVSTVADKDKLQSQLFFKRVQNGDKVLIYTKAERVVLYRPSTGKIIEFITLSNNTEQR